MTTERYVHDDTEARRLLRSGERGRDPLPLKGYAALLGLFGVSVGGLFSWAFSRQRLLDKISPVDLALLGIGSHKLARMISRDRVGTVLRQPFTVYDGTEGALPGEANEHARHDRGEYRQAVGELLCCPYCTSTWSATALFGTYLADHRLGRSACVYLCSIALAEVSQKVYQDLLN
jgi:hypothetical protein